MALPYLQGVKPQVVAHDVVILAHGSKTLHKVGHKSPWVSQVEELVSREGNGEVVLLCKPEHDVEHSAAGGLVGFEEHDVCLGMARRGRDQQLLVAL